jgi:hypothetical protein
MKHNLLWLWIVLGILALLAIIYLCLPKSKKRYLSYFLRQVPSLIARYFV